MGQSVSGNTTTGRPRTGSDDIVITIDAMGGDRGVIEVVRGMGKSLRKNNRLRYIVHGDEELLTASIRKKSPLAGRVEIRHADGVIGMNEKPSKALRSAKGTSMWNALQSVKSGESSAVISCGNTGALMAMSMIALRKAPGVERPAIAIMWPSMNPSGYNVLLDAGADIRADAADLLTFALMGASYARNSFGLDRPRVGLLNVGVEEHKGRPELHEAAKLIEAAGQSGLFDYIGYVEGADMPTDRVDVIVTDGFTGNVALKSAEGTARLIGTLLREAFEYTILSRLGGVFAYTSLKRFKKRVDPRRANGGVFLGLNGTVIKSHGDSDATGFSAAIKLAASLADSDFTESLAARVALGVAKSNIGNDIPAEAEEAAS